MMVKKFMLVFLSISLIGIALGNAKLVSAQSLSTHHHRPHPPHQVSNPAQYVNPFIGTGSGGKVVGAVDTFPGADVPFGMMQWSPDTPQRALGGGYTYGDPSTLGFSLTHISGPGCGAYGDIPILPTVGNVGSSPAKATESFSHKNESASPGYYGVTLGNGVKSQLTVTKRTGLGQFTFPSTTKANMLFKVADSQNGQSAANIQIAGPNKVTGSVTTGHFCGAKGTYTVHFAAVFNRNFSSYGTWNGSSTKSGQVKGSQSKSQLASTSGTKSGGWVSFDTTKNRVVKMKVGISYVSLDNAKLNLQTENHGWSFDHVRHQATNSWNRLLRKIQVSGGSKTDKTKFYTALYHSLLHPNLFSDVNGQYMGFDNKVHTVQKRHAQYANYSGWDIYRSDVPLMAMMAPSQTSDMMQSLVNDQQQGGWLPKWGYANDYTGVMNGDAADPIIAEAYAFGARNFDVKGALKAMIKGATDYTSSPGQGWYMERPGLKDYLKYGYVPGNASETLEYAIADSSIAQFAKAIGDTSVYNTFSKRGQNWQNIFNPAAPFTFPNTKTTYKGWIEARNGVFFPQGPAFHVKSNNFGQNGFEEGNAIQYSWMVPQNLSGLFNAMGGDKTVINRLDTFFTKMNAGPNQPYMWSGNEPSLNIPWEYNYAGEPWRTQQIVRDLMQTHYANTPGGEPGNDDLGAMSSWFVWSALGMYPETPGTTDLTLAAPLFKRTIIHLNKGRQIIINAPQASDSHPYIQKLKVNGKTTQKTWISFGTGKKSDPHHHKRWKGTTRLDYTLGSTPDKSWGTAKADASPSYQKGSAPVMGFTSSAMQAVPAGTSGSFSFSVRNVTNGDVSVHWNATSPSGITLSQSSGDLSLSGLTTKSTKVEASVSSGTPKGIYIIPIHLKSTTSGNTSTSTVYVKLVVGKPGSLMTYFDNAGISSDKNPGQNTFDGSGWSYSEQALSASGINPGHAFKYNGISFSWPNYPSLLVPDNVVANGQKVNISGSGNTLAFLGSASGGPSYGTGTITYKDGSTQNFTLGFSDWTLNGGHSSKPDYNNAIAAKMQYRDTRNNGTGKDNTKTYIYYAGISLKPGKTIQSVTLPGNVNNGQLHVFAMTVGNAKDSNVGNPHPAYKSVSAAFNNTGISSDSSPSAGNFDGSGWSYSKQALQSAGFTAGKSTSFNGMNFTWPSAAAGSNDNIQAAGQKVHFSGKGSTLAFLGAANNGPSIGKVDINYTDGTVQQATLDFSDWTLNGGSAKSPAYNNAIAASLPYRNGSNGKSNVKTYIYYSAVTLIPNKTVESVTLPLSANQGNLHVFAMAIGNPKDPSKGNIALSSLKQTFNNIGISDDSHPGQADFDGGGWSYSAQALQKAGLSPGTSVTSNGVTYQWPNVASGKLDNTAVHGQTIALSGSGTELGLLGSATNGQSQGKGWITYTDGTQQSFTLTFSDWARPSGGNTTVASMSYRNNPNDPGGHDSTAVNVYSVTIPLKSGKTVRSVTLPPTTSGGQMHIFDVAIGK